jgi:hypothetical protein
MAKGPDEEDYYKLAHAFLIAYSSENDPAVVKDMTEAAKELKNTESNTPETEKKDNEDEAEDASSEDDSGADDEAGWEDIEDENTPAASRKGKQKKSKKGFSSVDKVSCQQPVLPIIGHSLVHLQLHAIIVDIL